MHWELLVLLSFLSHGAPGGGQITVVKPFSNWHAFIFMSCETEIQVHIVVYSLQSHWRQHQHHPMSCHIFRQTLGVCSPFWTIHPLIFLELLFSTIVAQEVSLRNHPMLCHEERWYYFIIYYYLFEWLLLSIEEPYKRSASPCRIEYYPECYGHYKIYCVIRGHITVPSVMHYT